VTQTIRLLGRFMNAEADSVDIVCDVAIATTPPSRQEIGAGGDVQLTNYPTAVDLYSVAPDSLDALRKGDWTHIAWPSIAEPNAKKMQVRQILIEGLNVRVIV